MFFYASKLIWFLLQPSTALVLLLLVGILAVGFNRAKLGAILVMLAAGGLFVGGFLPLGPALMLPLEDRFPRQEPDGPVTGIIVLGGGIDQHIGEKRGVTALVSEAGDRMTETVLLARRFPEARIVFAGGTAEVIPSGGPTEAQGALRFFRAVGIDEARVTVEDKSRTTAENARFAEAIVKPRPDERWLLVTSAWHMPRAVGCFRAVGWDVLPWPTDYRTSGPEDMEGIMPRPSYGLTMVDVATKEWLGLLAYWLSGRTDALFPAPKRG